jgi:hypothetical protein
VARGEAAPDDAMPGLPKAAGGSSVELPPADRVDDRIT